MRVFWTSMSESKEPTGSWKPVIAGANSKFNFVSTLTSKLLSDKYLLSICSLFPSQSPHRGHVVCDQEWHRVHLEQQDCWVDLQILHLCCGWRNSKTRRQDTADHNLQRHMPRVRGNICECDEWRSVLQGSWHDRIRVSWVCKNKFKFIYICNWFVAVNKCMLHAITKEQGSYFAKLLTITY